MCDDPSLKDINEATEEALKKAKNISSSLEEIGRLIREAPDTGYKRLINEKLVDTTGKKLYHGDIIYLYNGKQTEKKWSVERIEEINGKLFSRFDKYLGPVYTPIESTPPNWIMVIRSEESPGVYKMNVFHTDQIQYNFKEVDNGR